MSEPPKTDCHRRGAQCPSAALLLSLASVACNAVDVVAIVSQDNLVDGAAPGPAPRDSAAPIPSDSGASSCDALFCGDFEDGDLSDFDTTEEGGSLEVVDGVGFESTSALEAGTEGSGGRAVVSASLPPLDSDSLFLRSYLYVPSDIEISDIAVFHLGQGGTQFGVNLDLVNEGRAKLFFVENDLSAVSEPDVVPTDEWLCIELDMQIADTGGTASLRVNGTTILEVTDADTRPPDGVVLFLLGVDWSADSQAPARILLDEIILDDAPVGCLP